MRSLATILLTAALTGCAWFTIPDDVAEAPGLDLNDHLVRPQPCPDDADFYCTWKWSQYERHERARRLEEREERERFRKYR